MDNEVVTRHTLDYNKICVCIFSLVMMSLGLQLFGQSGDFSCDFDGDLDCDSDGDGQCDYENEHNDDLRNQMMEDAADLAAWMQWDSLQPNKSKGLLKLPESEVKRIRRNAFIWKHKNIKVGYCSEELIDKSIETVNTLLYNQAFKNINHVPVKVIGPHSRKKIGSVKSVEINGCSSFRSTYKFPYDSDVTIFYRDKKEIAVPFSGDSLRKREYSEICDILESIGFTNIKRKPKRDIIIGMTKNDGAIDSVYIDGNSDFKKGETFQYDVKVVVEYHSRLFSK